MKGQTFMPDFMASIVVFGLILTVFLSSWNMVLSSQTDDVSQKTATLQASHTSSFLVTTPGYPENWEQDSVEVEIAGFAEPDHLVQSSKLEAFREIDYMEQRELLQTGNYYMTIENESGVISMNGEPLEFGSSYSDASTVIPKVRNIRFNNSGEIQEAQLNYVVWN